MGSASEMITKTLRGPVSILTKESCLIPTRATCQKHLPALATGQGSETQHVGLLRTERRQIEVDLRNTHCRASWSDEGRTPSRLLRWLAHRKRRKVPTLVDVHQLEECQQHRTLGEI